MEQAVIPFIVLAASLLAALRWEKARRRRRQRKSIRARRAERDRAWEKTTGQVISDDWRS